MCFYVSITFFFRKFFLFLDIDQNISRGKNAIKRLKSLVLRIAREKSVFGFTINWLAGISITLRSTGSDDSERTFEDDIVLNATNDQQTFWLLKVSKGKNCEISLQLCCHLRPFLEKLFPFISFNDSELTQSVEKILASKLLSFHLDEFPALASSRRWSFPKRLLIIVTWLNYLLDVLYVDLLKTHCSKP